MSVQPNAVAIRSAVETAGSARRPDSTSDQWCCESPARSAAVRALEPPVNLDVEIGKLSYYCWTCQDFKAEPFSCGDHNLVAMPQAAIYAFVKQFINREFAGSSNESRAQDTAFNGGNVGNAQSPTPVSPASAEPPLTPQTITRAQIEALRETSGPAFGYNKAISDVLRLFHAAEARMIDLEAGIRDVVTRMDKYVASTEDASAIANWAYELSGHCVTGAPKAPATRAGGADAATAKSIEQECPACHMAKFVELETLFGADRTLPVRIGCPQCCEELIVTQTITVSLPPSPLAGPK